MSTNMSKEERLTRWMIFCETMINLVSLFSSLNFKKRIIIEEYSRERGKVGRLENLQPNFFLQISTKNQSSTNFSKSKEDKKIRLSFFLSNLNKPKIDSRETDLLEICQVFFLSMILWWSKNLSRGNWPLFFAISSWYKKPPFSPFSSLLDWPTKQENDCVQQVSFKPVPSTRNEHSLLFTVHQASRAPPDDVPINVHDCVYQRGQTFLIRPQHGSLDFYSTDNARFYEARVPRFWLVARAIIRVYAKYGRGSLEFSFIVDIYI